MTSSLNFEQMKRKLYLIILPFLLFSSVYTFVIQLTHLDFKFKFYINVLFIIVFTTSWFVAYLNRWTKVFEKLILLLMYSYHILAVYFSLRNYSLGKWNFTDSIFAIWLPLLVMYIFAVLKRRNAVIASILLLMSSMIPLLIFLDDIDAFARQFFTQLYLATIIYIIALIYAFRMIQREAEIEAMKKQLYLDSLTKIGNRYQVDEWLQFFVENAHHAPFSVIFFDIDYFKQINDEYGHLVGDQVLKEIVYCVQEELDEDGYFGRWGGEEFILITYHEEEEAIQKAEHLRQAVESYSFTGVDGITASFGVMQYREGDTVDSLLTRADHMLYESKKYGRNVVTSSGGTLTNSH